VPVRRMLATLGVAASMAFGVTPALAAEPSPDDAAFLRAAHQTNLAEIAAGRIAWGKATAPEVKAAAATFLRDHIRMNADVYQTARALRVHLPAEPTAEQQALNRRYEIAGKDTFDEYFISTQLAGHRETLAGLRARASEGGDPSVKALAGKAAPIVAQHQEMLRDAAEAEGLAGYAGMGGRPV
jgi:putative membrane protein